MLESLRVTAYPIFSKPHHVDVHQGDTKALVVLVKHTLKLVVKQNGALVETKTSPWIKGAALELNNRMRTRWTLLLMYDVPIRRQVAVGPSVRVRAVKVQRVTVITVAGGISTSDERGTVMEHLHVNTTRRARHKVAIWTSIIADEGDDDASISVLLLHVFKINRVGEFRNNARVGAGVLVFGLEENNWSAIGDLCFRDNLADFFDVAAIGQ